MQLTSIALSDFVFTRRELRFDPAPFRVDHRDFARGSRHERRVATARRRTASVSRFATAAATAPSDFARRTNDGSVDVGVVVAQRSGGRFSPSTSERRDCSAAARCICRRCFDLGGIGGGWRARRSVSSFAIEWRDFVDGETTSRSRSISDVGRDVPSAIRREKTKKKRAAASCNCCALAPRISRRHLLLYLHFFIYFTRCFWIRM